MESSLSVPADCRLFKNFKKSQTSRRISSGALSISESKVCELIDVFLMHPDMVFQLNLNLQIFPADQRLCRVRSRAVAQLFSWDRALPGNGRWHATRERQRPRWLRMACLSGRGGHRRSCECTYMKSTSESLSHPETSNGRAAGGNCVVVRRGGEQPEADLWSQTKVNPIRFATAASLRTSGEASGQSHIRFLSHLSYNTKVP